MAGREDRNESDRRVASTKEESRQDINRREFESREFLFLADTHKPGGQERETRTPRGPSVSELPGASSRQDGSWKLESHPTASQSRNLERCILLLIARHDGKNKSRIVCIKYRFEGTSRSLIPGVPSLRFLQQRSVQR